MNTDYPMPTENRSSNTEMVSVPRKLLETIRSFHWSQQDCNDLARAKSRAELIEILTKPAPQHQGEPVAWFTDDHLSDKSATTWDNETAERWRAKGWPVSQLYTHADPGEVEHLREGITKHWKVVCDQRAELDTLREQLRLMTGDYRTAIVNGHERITFLGGDCDSVEKMLADNPNYAKSQELLKRQP